MDKELEDKVSADSWFAWSKHVLMQLEADTTCLRQLKEEITKLRVEVGRLQIKSGAWGAVGGAIPVVVGLAIWLLKSSP